MSRILSVAVLLEVLLSPVPAQRPTESDGAFGLAQRYYYGVGELAENKRRAAELFREACDGGSASACSFLGRMSPRAREA